jgi:hypothetical protein
MDYYLDCWMDCYSDWQKVTLTGWLMVMHLDLPMDWQTG